VRRRDFISLLGGAGAAWPLDAHAQLPMRTPLVGVLIQFGADDPEYQRRMTGFLTDMRELGWIDGRNVRIEVRGISRDPAKLAAEAQRLVGLRPQVILATSTVTAQVLQKQTDTVPIVFAGASDPLASGLVTSLAHPSGNITGFSNFEFSVGAKWLELLKQAAPNINHVLVLMQPSNDGNRGLMRAIETAADSISVRLSKIDENNGAAVQREFPPFASQPNVGLIVLPNPSTTRDLIIALAIRYKVPGVYPSRGMAREGGFLAYDIDEADLYRGAANYIDRILNGEKPGNLPVQAPTKFHLVINLKTATTLGLVVPSSLLTTADEVIE
jgi:putative ABC transport system substrate-binding protein